MELPSICQRVVVPFTYHVHFTEGVFRPENDLLARTIREDGEPGPKKVLVVVDGGLLGHHPGLLEEIEGYAAAHAGVLRPAGPAIVVPGGETAKNDPQLVHQILRAVQEHGVCRHSYLIAVGGGAVLDLAGFAAATAHRGVRLIRVPTTVLSQNDSAVGVKNGINLFGSKNFLGTFAPPFAVLNDFGFLDTLEDRDWRGGISEAVKVALIRDTAFFDFIRDHAEALTPERREPAAMRHLIHRCAELHLRHIAGGGDPFETGSSRPLDFGHWAAHKLEQLTCFSLRHGEAVAIGIALDCTYSCLAGLLSEGEWEAILNTLEALGFVLYIPEMAEALLQPEHPRCLFSGLEAFREHLGGELTIMLLEGIGRGVEVHEVDHARYRRAIELLRARTPAPVAP